MRTNCKCLYRLIVVEISKILYFEKKESELAVTSSNVAWVPETEDDWITETIDLNAFAGSSDVLVAIVFTNANGNNIYLDNLDFFVSSEPSLIDLNEEVVRIFPNPSPEQFNVTFNLFEKERVNVRLIDMMGNQVLEQEFDNVLNQTLTFDTVNLRNGLYLIQFRGENFSTTERVVVMK